MDMNQLTVFFNFRIKQLLYFLPVFRMFFSFVLSANTGFHGTKKWQISGTMIFIFPEKDFKSYLNLFYCKKTY